MQKGQKLSEESKSLMQKSKQDKMLSKFNWVLVEPYLDVEIDNGASNRQRIHPTLRHFKDAMTSGRSMKSLRDLGVSKHVLQFMSNFSQGKIALTKEDFQKDYRSGLSLDEIGEKYQITRSDLTYLRQLYDIGRLGATYIARKQNEVPLTQRQKEIIYGSLMGDAKKVSSSAVGFGHGEKQKAYLFWKYAELQSVASENSLKLDSYFSEKRNKTYKSWRFYTHANSDIEKIISDFYGEDGKQVRKNVLDSLSALSIAVWYMDDGSSDLRKRFYRKNPNCNQKIVYSFCTDSFDLKSMFLIRDWFWDKWKIKTRIRRRGTNSLHQSKFRLIVCNEFCEKFVDIIKPYIVSCMDYKV